MAYVPVPKDLTKVKTKVMFNLTKRQLICFTGGALIGVPLFFLLRKPTGNSVAAMCMMLVMLPFFMLAMYEKHGQPLEKIVGNILKVAVIRPKQRPYQTNNFYAVLKRQETSMKPTSEILERIEKCSSEHKDGVFTRLYRYLLREDIYYAAYQKLYANKGATTQGIDNDTADGFSDFYVKELIQSLKDGTYKANPVRREYIPKKNGKLRPLGIPSFHDKLLQEVVRMILEAIYEPVFDSH